MNEHAMKVPSPSDSIFWQARYESGETHWDKGEAAPPLLGFLSEQPMLGRVLVPGCGAGHDVRALGHQGADVVGMDFAEGAIAAALRHENPPSVQFVQGDFFELPQDFYGAFDWIFEHTCFCAIHPSSRPAYVASCVKALRPEGRIMAIFYMEPDNDSTDSPPFRSSKEELDRLFLPWFEVVEECVPAVAFDGRSGRELLRVLRKK